MVAPTGWVVDLHIIFPVFNVGATIGSPHQTVNFPPHKQSTLVIVGTDVFDGPF